MHVHVQAPNTYFLDCLSWSILGCAQEEKTLSVKYFCKFVNLSYALRKKKRRSLCMLDWIFSSIYSVWRQTTASLQLSGVWSFLCTQVCGCSCVYHRAERHKERSVLSFLKGHIPLILDCYHGAIEVVHIGFYLSVLMQTWQPSLEPIKHSHNVEEKGVASLHFVPLKRRWYHHHVITCSRNIRHAAHRWPT